MKKFWRFVADNVPQLFLPGFGLAALFLLYTTKLGSLTNHLVSDNELKTNALGANLHDIIWHPLNTSYNIAHFAISHVAPHQASYARLTSALIAVVATVMFFCIVYRWHGKRSAIFATILFSTTSWMLHAGRAGDIAISLTLVPLGIILFASWLSTTEKHGTALLSFAAFFAGTLTIPGAIWFLLFGTVMLSKQLWQHLKAVNLWQKILSLGLVVAVLTWLAYCIVQTHDLAIDLLGIPQELPNAIALLHQWAHSASYLFVRGPFMPASWLGHTPILDIFASVMCVLGLCFYATHLLNKRSQLLFGLLVIGSVMVGLRGAEAMSFVVPLAYLCAATGIAYLLRDWLRVFPRNPLARSTGLVIVSLAVGLASLFGISRYFIAWHNSPETVTVFRHKP